MTKYVKVSDFFYHVINYSLFTSEPEIDLIFLLNLVNFNLPRDFFRQNSELGKSRGKAPKAVTRVCLGLQQGKYLFDLWLYPVVMDILRSGKLETGNLPSGLA